MEAKVFWVLLGVLVIQVAGMPVTDEDQNQASNEIEAPKTCPGTSGRKCYSKGPLLSKDLLLPTKRNAVQVDTGPISCEEVTGYIMALHRAYSRKCANMADNCPDEYRYAISWFGRVGQDMAKKCDAETGNE